MRVAAVMGGSYPLISFHADDLDLQDWYSSTARGDVPPGRNGHTPGTHPRLTSPATYPERGFSRRSFAWIDAVSFSRPVWGQPVY
jgi:hypothetical protein